MLQYCRARCCFGRRVGVGGVYGRGSGPYGHVLRALQNGGAGLLAAAEVFRQFEQYYRVNTEQKANGNGPDRSLQSSSPSSSSLMSVPNTSLPTHDQQLPSLSSSPASSANSASKKKLLTSFCGNPAHVEPMTVLLLKVLCDLQRLEEMRFLFTQCVLELDEQPPSTDLFNVYLMAISMTDTFNRNEIENVIDLMHTKQVKPDVVTKLSVLILYMRLGQHTDKAWWVSIRAEIRAIAAGAHALTSSEEKNSDDGADEFGQTNNINNFESDDSSYTSTTERNDLLVLRVRHCFQTMMRLHYDVTMMHECFELLVELSAQRLSETVLVQYFLHGVHNMAMPSLHSVQVLQLLVDSRHANSVSADSQLGGSVMMRRSDSKQTSDHRHHNDSSDTIASSNTEEKSVVHINEISLLRLLAKCVKWKDVTSAGWVYEYFMQQQQQQQQKLRHSSQTESNGSACQASSADSSAISNTVQEHRHPDESGTGVYTATAALLYIHALADGGELCTALRVLERAVGPPHHNPSERPKFAFTVPSTGKRVLLLQSDPMTTLIHAIATRGGVACVLRELPRKERNTASSVTALSLDTLMAACAVQEDYRCAEKLLSSYRAEFGVTPTSDSFAALLRAYAVASPSAGVTRIFSAMKELCDSAGLCECEPSASLIQRHTECRTSASVATNEAACMSKMSPRRGVLGAAFLRAAMDVSLRAGDVSVAIQMAELHASHGVTVSVTMSSALLRMLSLSLDATMLQRGLSALRASRSIVDERALAQARALFKRCNTQWSHA